ncbi:hypothetical protein HF324_13775 [Chitinophaga oryzae]|uniref:Secretin/TonB short N-terminal domain-containing protein n=1 Tax=Chitinophaga oryzae TaxID=2725414 RepID=A0ABX6LG31_9BACT|nr:porin family protein [Chitinophaga oryzae]QJB38875.1 hypothetical protein HF324_13775 [Chitinophaga oryzae]
MKKKRSSSTAPAVVGRWLLAVLLLSGVLYSYGQLAAVNLQKNIIIPAGEIPLDKLLKAVGQQTGTRFSLNTRKFSPSRLIRIRQKIQPLGVLLDDIQKQTGISYKLLGGHVIFVDALPVKHVAAAKVHTSSVARMKASVRKPVAAGKTVVKTPLAMTKAITVTKPVVDSAVQFHLPATDTAVVIRDIADTTTAGIKRDTLPFRLDSPYVTAGIKRDTLPFRQDSLYVTSGKKRDTLPHRKDTGLLNLSLRKSSPEGKKERKRWGIGNIELPGIGTHTPPDTTVKKEDPVPPLTAEAIRKQPAANNPQQKTTNFPEMAASGQAGGTGKVTRLQKSGGTRERSFFLSSWFHRSSAGGIRNNGDGPRPGLIPFVGAGVSMEESFIVNGQLQAGMPFLYAIASWGTGRNTSGLRYGAGISVPPGENWRLHLQATIGKMQFEYDSTDFVKKEIRMQWQKLALIGERRLNDHLGVQAGISLNILRSEYYTMDHPASLGREEEVALKDVRYFKPLYTISDTFSPDAVDNRKMWLGVQVSIIYRLHFRKAQ